MNNPRPEKNSAEMRKRADIELEADSCELWEMSGWDKCCDAWEKFLPSRVEIQTIIGDIGSPGGMPLCMTEEIAGAIIKRIGGG